MAPVHISKLAFLLACTAVRAAADEHSVVVTTSRRLPLLNRVTFKGNVHAEGPTAEHWIVMFCVNWWGTCQALRETYSQQAFSHETRINANAVLLPRVRFAEVDCAVDKVLCNEQSVENYPTIAHYHGSTKISSWTINSRNTEAQARRISKYLDTETQSLSLGKGVGQGSSAQVASVPDDEKNKMKTVVSLVPFAIAAVGLGLWILTQSADLYERIMVPVANKSEHEFPDTSKLSDRLPVSWTCRPAVEL